MVSHELDLFLGPDRRTAFRAHGDFVFGVLEVFLCDHTLVRARSKQSRFVHEVGKVRAREGRRAFRNARQIDVRSQRNAFGMDPQDFLATHGIGQVNLYLAIKTTGTQQGFVEDVGAVGRSDQDDTFIGFETVHFHQQLVQRLLALLMTA